MMPSRAYESHTNILTLRLYHTYRWVFRGRNTTISSTFVYLLLDIDWEGMGALNHFFNTAATGVGVHSLPRNKGVIR